VWPLCGLKVSMCGPVLLAVLCCGDAQHSTIHVHQCSVSLLLQHGVFCSTRQFLWSGCCPEDSSLLYAWTYGQTLQSSLECSCLCHASWQVCESVHAAG
jgi:hypothetical protein